MWNQIKTIILLGLLSGLVLSIGYMIGGNNGIVIALILAIIMNFGMYFWSHKLVLAMYRAKPATKKEYPHLHKMVEDIAHKIGIPKPTLYIVPTETPNAFATGPSPKKAVVACTEGILKLLNDNELKGVLAHELSHVKNRDMLVTTIAATLAAVISTVARIALWTGVSGDRDRGIHPIAFIFLIIVTPIAALLIQLAISRSREYLADETGAKTIKDSHSLANALSKLENGCKAKPLHMGNPTTSSLFIVNPFTARGLVALFSTHPSTKDRIERLSKMKF
ncbi:MAG TPA: zinc metalloprotease HtpX [Candidatus Nanoarchaeia archaeon]|nr:zinc metalloprotease HtpX [Candidatus Nanoarchaeia archaeon]